MTEYVITFLALFVTDIFYTQYLSSVNNKQALKASAWAAVVFIVASVAVINYTEDHWQLIPAALGAFTGTWAGIQWRKRQDKDLPG